MPDDDIYTDSLHAGQEPDAEARTRAPPIYQTTSYVFEDADDAASQFALEKPGYIYSRLMNPTVDMLQERLAALEGGVGAIATSSGMAALNLVTFLLADAGDNVVTASSLYGGTYTYYTHSAPRQGVEARFVDTLDYEAYEAAIDEDTAYVHYETIGNPALVTPDMERIADIAHEHDVPVFVDNTFATPALCNPLDHGADIVWNSTTKWIHGSGTTIGGAVIDGGSFPWADHAEKFPEIGDDNPAYHGINFAETFGDAALTYAGIARGLRDMGNQQSPFDAWQTIQGIESLPMRMERHCENAMAVAEHLADHPDVAWVTYPGLESHETHGNASKYLDGGGAGGASNTSTDGTSVGGYGGMITFGLEGGYEAAQTTVENTELASLLANVGDAKTLIIHPASTTHQQLTEEEQEASGVTPDLVRLSVGLESTDAIVEDLDQAIDSAT